MITITKEIEEKIKEGKKKYKNLLVFRVIAEGKSNGKLCFRYVTEDENTEEIIKKITSEINHMGVNLGQMFELVYNHDYIEENNVTKITFEKIYEIKKGSFGYIDVEGNFYPLGEIDKHDEGFRFDKPAGKIASSIVLLLNIPEEEKDKLKVQNQRLMEKRFSRYYWPADSILEQNGFCLFFRGINEDGTYSDQSYFDKANEKQLAVLSYLYTLNYIQDTNIEEKRKSLIRKLVNSNQK